MLTWKDRGDDVIEVQYRELYYAAPKSDVVILPLSNISAEKLAAYVGQELLKRIGSEFPEMPVERLKLCVEETSGQQGCWTFIAG